MMLCYMRGRVLRAVVFILSCCEIHGCPASGQEPQKIETKFEVAAVKRRTAPTVVPPPNVMYAPFQPFRYSGQRITCAMPLDVIISYAFDISQQQIVGPKWLNEEVYEIEAIMPAGTKRQASRLMLQALLAERFGLQFHRETKDTAGYELFVSPRGHKLRPSSGDSAAPKVKMSDEMHSLGSSQHPGGYQAWSVTMSTFAEWLSAWTQHPIADSTGLTGRYDIELSWEPSEDELSGGRQPVTSEVFKAVEQQLGLKLQKRTVSVELFVIDHAEKVPTPN